MSFPIICNFIAWGLCGVFAFLLFGDFIHIEYQFAKEKKKLEVGADEPKDHD